MKTKRWIPLIVTVLLAAGGTPFAQPSGPPPPPPPGDPEAVSPAPSPEVVEQNRDMMRQVMVSRLTRDLGLSDEQSLLVMRRFGELDDRQLELRQQRLSIMRKLRPVLKQQRDEAALEHLMKELDSVNQQSAASEQTLRSTFDGMNLNVWQKAKLELFLSDFENQIRRIVQQAQGRHPGMAGPGPARPGGPLRDGAKIPPQRPPRVNAPDSPPPPPVSGPPAGPPPPPGATSSSP